MGKAPTEETDTISLERKLLEKKKLLSSQANSHDGNGVNNKKSKEEKEKIRRAMKKKKRKQKKKENGAEGPDSPDEEDEDLKREAVPKPDFNPNVEVEYVDQDEYLLTGKYYDEFKHVFQYFTTPKPDANQAQDEDDEDQAQDGEEAKPADGEQQLSRKKKKMLKRLKVAQLKAQVKRPDVVEVWDTTAKDPLTLVYLKSYKNSVPVPRHWSQKRKFLQNKRGILKPPFKLPEHIEKTGIARLRDPFNDKEAGRLVRQKLRERMNPKLGKIDIDYEILHNAFFKFQERPKMTRHGDIYYEGKEDEVKMQSYRPGRISEQLRQALGISEFAPPPWIVNMQRYGPPPSYPSLKIPGLNAPLPDGSGLFGGRPLDEHGRPILYGQEYEEENVDKTLWGEPMEEDIEEQLGEQPEEDETAEPRAEPEVRSGTSSVVSGMAGIETPDIELQKRGARKTEQPPLQNFNYNPNDTVPKPLYQVLEPVQRSVGADLYGSAHGYVIPGVNDQSAQQQPQAATKDKKDGKEDGDKDVKFKF